MTAPEPLISVIMATWGRGRHILPSIRSVLQQDFGPFELIVVGDACADETEAVVAGLADHRVRWRNLANRCGSQSAPNNAGIAAARGRIIAYLGHDDIWEPNHLTEIARRFAGDEGCDFVVSGLINHPPGGLPGGSIMGIFDDDGAKRRHFFPPSCFAHRREVTDRIGPWRMPLDIRAPVDADLLLRAVAAGLRFVSTGTVTVHKFASADRYLSYVRQRSDEQTDMLSDMASPGHAARIAAIVEQSRRMGRFMIPYPQDYGHHAPGDLARLNAAKRGLLRPELRPLGAGAVIRPRHEPSAQDWQTRPLLGIRRHARNPRPRILLPFAATGEVLLRLRVVHPHRAAFGPLEMTCNDAPVTAVPTRLRRGLWGWTAIYRAVVTLEEDRPSILELRLTKAQLSTVPFGLFHLGFGIGRLRLTPVSAR
jgi:hypothetical protein